MYCNYSQLSIKELHSLIKKGHKKAFNTLFERYWKRLYTYAYRIYPNEKVCEDIVQELFIDLWKKLKTAEIENLEGYLFRAVKYKIATFLRDLKFTEVHNEVLREISVEPKIERQLEYLEFEDHVNREIKKLPQRCQKVFMLSRFEHCSNAEIAHKLNISVRTVETHISNAIRQLKNVLNPYEFLSIIILMFF